MDAIKTGTGTQTVAKEIPHHAVSLMKITISIADIVCVEKLIDPAVRVSAGLQAIGVVFHGLRQIPFDLLIGRSPFARVQSQ